MRRLNLLGYSEKQGYKIQSSAGEEWERDRREISVGRAKISEIVQDALKLLMASPEKPKLKPRSIPWSAVFSDGREADGIALLDPRDEAAVRIDFRYLTSDERSESAWTKRSGEKFFEHRIVWVCADIDPVETAAREMAKSQEMVRSFTPRQGSLGPARQLPDLFPHFQPLQITPSELLQLLEPELVGPSPKFLVDQLGILDLDGGKYVAG